MNINNFRTSKEILEDDTIKHRIYHWQKFVIPFICIIGLYALWLFLLSMMVNTSDLKTKLNTSIQEMIKVDKDGKGAFNISGDIEFKVFFKPTIIINNIKAANLVKGNYYFDFDIKQIKLNVSSLRLLTKKIVVNKIEIIDGNFDVLELNNSNKKNNIDKIIDLFTTQIISNNNLELQITNNDIEIKNDNYTRKFESINILSIFNSNRLEAFGTLASNKQPLGIDLLWQKWKKEKTLKLNLFAQAFNIKADSKYIIDTKQIEGRVNFDIVNLQIFTKTFFNPDSFLYQRVIDNSDLKGHLTFNYLDNVINVQNLIFNGTNLVGVGAALINLSTNQDNIFKFNIESINIDNLITKNFINKSSININESNIFIFSGQNTVAQEENNQTYIQKLFNKNRNNFDVSIKKLILNRSNLLNFILNFSYHNGTIISVNNISGLLPGETKLLMKNNADNKTLFSMSGNNLYEFWNFLKNTKYTINQDNEKFAITGYFSMIYNKIFLNDTKFNTNMFETVNNVEIALNDGISYIAVDSNINNIVLDDILKVQDNSSSSVIHYDGGSLKNKMLFLNEFSLNSFLKFNITNLKYKDLIQHNYSFTVKTSQGMLDIDKINLNNEITGKINFDIKQLTPIFNMTLNIENHNFDHVMSMNSLLFDIPTFNNYNGQISIKGKNSKLKDSNLNNFNITAKIQNGVFNIEDFTIDGFGGNCNITGFLDLNFDRKINLVFNACTADLGEILYLFTKRNNINGLVGFSSVLYSHGNTLNAFLNNYILKIQLIGSGINIESLGLESLNTDLIRLNTAPELAHSLQPNNILMNKNSQTLFNNLSGNIQYIGGRGQLDIDVSRPLINGKITGSFEFSKNDIYSNIYANFIMLVGTLNNTVNLTLPISITGTVNSGLKTSVNFQQIDDYINTIKQVQ